MPDEILLRKEKKTKTKENGIWTPLVHKEDKKGLNEHQMTIFSTIRLIVIKSCGPFVLHRYAWRFEWYWEWDRSQILTTI